MTDSEQVLKITLEDIVEDGGGHLCAVLGVRLRGDVNWNYYQHIHLRVGDNVIFNDGQPEASYPDDVAYSKVPRGGLDQFVERYG